MKEIIFICIFGYAVFKLLKWLFTSDKKKLQKSQSDVFVDFKDIPPFTPTTKRTPLSGSFHCPVCGATTAIKNQMYPMPKCQYCDAPIPDLRRMIDKYDSIYQACVRREQEDYISAAKEAIRLKNMQLKADKELKTQKLRNKQARIENRDLSSVGDILCIILGFIIIGMIIYWAIVQSTRH